ncbi:MAG: hypothetical protein K0S32_3614 [Bacteroidetes bacterium]|jgi:transposase-like protein|nr:hypothetical protein [Bacteroidota bacterium]
MESISSNLILNVWKEKCPHCKNSDVFEKRKHFFAMPEMKSHCSSCGYQFDREPGYFIGAMYISYGLAVFQGIVTFLLFALVFPEISTIWRVIAVIFAITLFSLKNYKLSRIIYIHIFPG